MSSLHTRHCGACDTRYTPPQLCRCFEKPNVLPPHSDFQRIPVSCCTEAPARKAHPVATGVVDYFPDAIRAVAHCSYVGNEQHNPGKPMHWDRSKSGDESDALMRHFLERGTMDTDGVRHSAKVAWRALAMLQKEIESERKEDEK